MDEAWESTLAQSRRLGSSSVTTRFWQMAMTFSLMERMSLLIDGLDIPLHRVDIAYLPP